MRVLAVFLASTFLRILSGFVSPMVGWPSVKKTMVKVRPCRWSAYSRAAAARR